MLEVVNDNYMNLLPDEIMLYIGSFMDVDNKLILGRTNHRNYGIFFIESVVEKVSHKLLEYVSQGEQDKAEVLIKKYPQALVHRSNITDWTDGDFESISPWEYVLWALDTRYMVNMMLSCIPNNSLGKQILQKLIEQYQIVKTKGVKYTREGILIRENHFNFDIMINKLEVYVQNYDIWNCLDRAAYWKNEIGKEQRNLIVHARQHFCDPNNSFNPTPDFKCEKFMRCLKVYDSLYERWLIWDNTVRSHTSKLGQSFAICRGNIYTESATISSEVGITAASLDMSAIQSLKKERLEDFKMIEEKLELLSNLVYDRNNIRQPSC